MTGGNSIIASFDKVSLEYRRKLGLFRSETSTILDEVSFELHRGESLGVVGRNGAGKSTLLRLLAGIIEADSGSVTHENIRISLLTLQLGFIEILSGQENALLGAMMLGLSYDEAMHKLDEIIDFSELGDKLEQHVATYSAGMRARLAFSVAYVCAPDIILIDEMMGVGDAHFRAKSAGALKEMILSDKTVVIVSHNDGMLRNLCDRVLWIENGRVAMCGDVDEVMDRYLESLV